MFHVVDRGLCYALREEHDAIRDFLRQDARVAPNDGGDRNPDIGKYIRRCVDDGVAAHQHDQDRQHDECVRPL
jgi:hypothetical protein